MRSDSRVYIAGHRGMVGSAITRRLVAEGFEAVILRTRDELPLDDADRVEDFFQAERPEFVVLAAAKSEASSQMPSTVPISSVRT